MPHELRIVQQFKGLNPWDQLSVDVEISGTLPEILVGVSLTIPDITDEYSYTSDTSLRSVNNVKISLDDREISCDIDQQVHIAQFNYIY